MAEQNEPRMSDIADLGGDRSLVARMEALIREHVKRVKDDDAHLLALFIAVQHREDEREPCNMKRHVEIINMLSRYEKLTRPRASERLCALAQALYNEKAEHDAQSWQAPRSYNPAGAQETCWPAYCEINRLLAAAVVEQYAEGGAAMTAMAATATTSATAATAASE